MKKPAVYRLYAARVTEETAEQAARNRFHRLTPDYILLYSCRKPGKPWVEVEGEDWHRLTKVDETWLWDCAFAMTAEVMERRKGEVNEALADLIDRLEEALEAEAAKEERGE